MEDAKDDLFSRQDGETEPFRFDDAVARVFPDMVRRSVPCYEQLVVLSGLIGRRFVLPGTDVYYLGGSLDAVTLSLLEQVLIPEESELHLERLREAGFPHCTVWFQCLNVVSFPAWT